MLEGMAVRYELLVERLENMALYDPEGEQIEKEVIELEKKLE